MFETHKDEESKMEKTPIYKVTKVIPAWGEIAQEEIPLGYATGDPRDIENFYEGNKEYPIHVNTIKVIPVTPEAVKEKRDLLDEESNLRKRLGELEKILGR